MVLEAIPMSNFTMVTNLRMVPVFIMMPNTNLMASGIEDGRSVRALALRQQGRGFEPRLDLFISAGGVMPTVIPIKEWEAAVYTRIVRQWGGAYYKYSLTAHMSRRF